MKVVIYRPQNEATHVCAVALSGTPDWAVEELIRRSGLDPGALAEERETPGIESRLWTSLAFDQPDIPGIVGARVASDESPFIAHPHSNAITVFYHWDASVPLHEVLGNGWWRFLSGEGAERFLGGARADGEGRAPSLSVRLRTQELLAGDPAAGVRWKSGHRDGHIYLYDWMAKEPAGDAYFSPDGQLDQTGCYILQQLGEVIQIAGVGLHLPPEGQIERALRHEPGFEFRLTLLFMDPLPKPGAPAADTGTAEPGSEERGW